MKAEDVVDQIAEAFKQYKVGMRKPRAPIERWQRKRSISCGWCGGNTTRCSCPLGRHDG